MSQIAYIANLWTLAGHPSAPKEWPLAKKIQAVAEAGFDGITGRLTLEHRRWAEDAGLKHLIGFFSSTNPDDFASLLAAQKDAGAPRVNVHLDDHDTPPKLSGMPPAWPDAIVLRQELAEAWKAAGTGSK